MTKKHNNNNILGHNTPHTKKENKDKKILIHPIKTPLGDMLVGATPHGICLLEFAEQPLIETELKDLQRLLKSDLVIGKNAHTHHAKAELKNYFDGKIKKFTVPLVTPGSTFRTSVWDFLKTVPYGKTLSYQVQAEGLGNVLAVRAVASANGANRISIIIPCHRIISKSGSLGGYAGGLERKKWLLDHENYFI